MILSVSRRTDIPAFYSEWFFNRLKEGFVDVRNPMNIHQISRINIKPEVVDCIVFWTKNPRKMIKRLQELDGYNYYFQFTVNPYDIKIEEYVPSKSKIIETFKELSDKIGPERVIWRYDPILFTEKIDINYHIKYFKELLKRLNGYTRQCVISFVDLYKKTVSNTKTLGINEPSELQMRKLANSFVEIAKAYNIKIVSCSEKINLEEEGIEHGHCIDPIVIERICNYTIKTTKDKNQRKECGCIESIDIGAYNTCNHKCSYCYANFNTEKVKNQSSHHIPTSSLLIGEIQNDDIVKERKVHLLKTDSLFEIF